MKPQHGTSFKVDESREHDLYKAIGAIQTVEEARLFLQDLCTPAELQAMADRWNVVGYIKKGMSYRQIYEKTGVSVTTIGRVARFLTMGEGGYNKIFKRVNTKK